MIITISALKVNSSVELPKTGFDPFGLSEFKAASVRFTPTFADHRSERYRGDIRQQFQASPNFQPARHLIDQILHLATTPITSSAILSNILTPDFRDTTTAGLLQTMRKT